MANSLALAKIYARHIVLGMRSPDDVPEILKEEVARIVEEMRDEKNANNDFVD